MLSSALAAFAGLGLAIYAQSPAVAQDAIAPNQGALRPQMRPLWMEELPNGGRRPRPNPFVTYPPQVAEATVEPQVVQGAAATQGLPHLPSDGAAVAVPDRPQALQPLLFPPVVDADVVVDDYNWPAALPNISTRDVTRTGFLERRRALESQLSSVQDLERAEVALELARLLMGQMLLPEARSYLQLAWRQGIKQDPGLLGQAVVIERMLDVLGHDKWAGDLARPWQEDVLWRLAAGVVTLDDHAVVADAMAALNSHSLPVIEALLPPLFEAALEVNNLVLAEALLRGALEVTGLSSQPIYLFMQGKLALKNGLSEQAFDYFARGGLGNDLAAQRSRIAMADIAIERRDPKLLPALRDILREGVNQWRHGPEALVLRARLAQVAEDLGDIPLALDIMGKIRLDHPNTPEAILAHERGSLALAAFSVAVDADEIDLETYLRSLRHVEPFYRTDPIWPIARAALARSFARNGLHVAAAAEYQALQGDLGRLGAAQLSDRQRQLLATAEAQAHLSNFKIAPAALALAREGLPTFTDLVPQYEMVALQARTPGVVHLTLSDNAPERLAIHAQAAREQGFDALALSSYQRLDEAARLTSRPADYIHALLLGLRNGHKDFAQDLFGRGLDQPSLSQTAAQPELFEAIATPLPNLMPLSRGLADQMLSRSENALSAASAVVNAAPGQPVFGKSSTTSDLLNPSSNPPSAID